MSERKRPPRKPQRAVAPIVPVVPPRRLLGNAGPLVVGVAMDAEPDVFAEWSVVVPAT
jgi:hypothetical protein